jgi:hypothetical protein
MYLFTGDKMKLSKEDWTQLDLLLSKVGFGGYYDFVECLRMAITNLAPELSNVIKKEADIQMLVTLLLKVSTRSEK